MRSAVRRFLLHVARKVLQGIIDEIGVQKKVVQDVVDAIQGRYIPLLDSWIGDDADAFRDEVRTRLIPEIMALIAAILGMSTGLTQAVTTIENADNGAVKYTEELADAFRAIYRN